MCGDGVGATKVNAARAKGVEIWTEDEFNDAVAADDDSEEESSSEEDASENDDDDDDNTSATSLDGRVICFTGRLRSTRAEATRRAQAAGARVTKTVTKATEVLVRCVFGMIESLKWSTESDFDEFLTSCWYFCVV